MERRSDAGTLTQKSAIYVRARPFRSLNTKRQHLNLTSPGHATSANYPAEVASRGRTFCDRRPGAQHS